MKLDSHLSQSWAWTLFSVALSFFFYLTWTMDSRFGYVNARLFFFFVSSHFNLKFVAFQTYTCPCFTLPPH